MTAAQDFIRENNSLYGYPDGGITVKIKEGDYFMTDSFLLGSSDSGKTDAPIVWEGEGNVRFIGGTKLLMDDFTKEEDKDGFYTYSTGSENTFPITSMPVTGASVSYLKDSYNPTPYYPLLFNGEYKTLARYPNDEYDVIAAVQNVGSIAEKEGFEFTPTYGSDRVSRWKSEANLCAQGYWGVDYTDLGTPASITESGTIKTKYPSGKTPLAGQRFYVYNALCELDTDGEYYIDNSTGTVYLCNEFDRDGEIIIGTNTTSLLCIRNAVGITFRGIECTGARNNGINISDSENIKIENCTINGVNGYGIYTNNVKTTVISGCTIKNTGCGGIRLNGGDFARQIAGDNLIINNTIHDFSKVRKTYSPAVSVSGYANKIQNNTMYNGEHEALTVTGNDNVITGNDIYDVVKEASDMGAIYVGKNKALRGNEITNNYIHDLATNSVLNDGTDIQAIFLDDLLDGYKITENIFANIKGRGIKLAGGRDNTITDNVFVNCSVADTLVTAIGLVAPDKYKEHINADTVITSGVYKKAPYTKYPHLAELDFTGTNWLYPMYNTVSGNYTYGSTKDIEFSTYGESLTNITGSSRYNMFRAFTVLKQSDFKDFANGDYSYGDIVIGNIGAN